MVELNPQITDQLKILISSPVFMHGLMCFRKNVDQKSKKDIVNAGIRLQQYPNGKQILKLFRIDKIIPFKPAQIQTIESLLKEYEKLRALLSGAESDETAEEILAGIERIKESIAQAQAEYEEAKREAHEGEEAIEALEQALTAAQTAAVSTPSESPESPWKKLPEGNKYTKLTRT